MIGAPHDHMVNLINTILSERRDAKEDILHDLIHINYEKRHDELLVLESG